MINFIKGLGYKARVMPGFIPPIIPFALMAGLGEMGRMNRLVSPLYGGALRLDMILTDLPLALDKPIDFGLQTFCKGCKKCAKACPVDLWLLWTTCSGTACSRNKSGMIGGT